LQRRFPETDGTGDAGGASNQPQPSHAQVLFRTMSSSFRSLLASLIVLSVAACSAAGGASSGASNASDLPGIAHPTGPGDLVLRLRHVGGFAPASFHFTQTPAITVYGDGTVIVPGPVPAIYPGPAMPNLQRATISPAGIQKLLEAAREAGLLGPDAHYDLGGIMDASTAEFTVNGGGGVHTVSAYALMEGMQVPQGTDPAVVAARAKLATFQSMLGNLEGLLGTDIGPWTSYEAAAVQLLVTNGAPQDDQGLGQEPIAWPLDTPLGGFGETHPDLFQGERCGVVTGDDLEALRPLLAQANSLTPWTDDDAAFGIGIRPLLPDETGCPPTK
jgi:hypothetical protein